MTQVARTIGVISLCIAAACGGNASKSSPVVSIDPVGAVRQFMAAVDRNDLTALSSLWGTSEGLAADKMDGVQLQRRLTVMQRYLRHEEYEVLDADAAQQMTGLSGEQHLRVRLTRNSCYPVVPVTLVRLRGGWIVKAVDLTQAGNPERAC